MLLTTTVKKLQFKSIYFINIYTLLCICEQRENYINKLNKYLIQTFFKRSLA